MKSSTLVAPDLPEVSPSIAPSALSERCAPLTLSHHSFQVRLRPDERYGAVRFATADAVQSAIDALHGTKICGEKISVTRMDPLMAAHNSKRPRMAPNQAEHSLGHPF